jgi:N-acetylglucosaminyldiphosphoundecaprenol N-acetyl-beta-D-mannosaminyltransferase
MNFLKNKRIELFGIEIDNITFDEAIDRIVESIENKEKNFICTPNVDHIIKLQSDSLFRLIYSNAGLVLNDSKVLFFLSKILKTPLVDKISGSELLPALCRVASEKGYSLFFLGGREESAKISAQKYKENYPSIKIAGTYSPPFGFKKNKKENIKILKLISDASPDILFVGLGAPKQEKWIYDNLDKINARVSIGIGAAFEFASGKVGRAPRWISNCGMEWFWRLIKEPRRLWKRYLVDDVKIFSLFIKELKKQLK